MQVAPDFFDEHIKDAGKRAGLGCYVWGTSGQQARKRGGEVIVMQAISKQEFRGGQAIGKQGNARTLDQHARKRGGQVISKQENGEDT